MPLSPRRLVRVGAFGAALSAAGSVGPLAFAQTEPAVAAPTLRPLPLADALTFAYAHQPAIRAALARVSARHQEARIPDGQWLPVIGATGQVFAATANNSTASYLNQDFVDIPRIGGAAAATTGTWRPYASNFLGVSATQELFDFGRIAAQRAAGDALTDVESHDADAVRLDLAFNVEEAYFAVYAAKGVVTASDDAYERARVHRDLAQSGVASGMRSPIELTRAEADFARADTGRVRAHGGLQIAQTVLAASIGSTDAAVDVVKTAPTVAEMPSLADAIQRAAARDPKILAALSQLQASEAKTHAIGAEKRPDLLLTGTLSGRAGGAPLANGEVPTGTGLLPVIPNWDAGLAISWPIFDGTVNARERAAHAREDVARDEIDAVRLRAETDVRRTYVQVDVARAALPSLQRAVDAAHANYAQADARFRAGLGTSVELADAEALRTDSEIQLAMGVFDLARARAAFGRAIAEGI